MAIRVLIADDEANQLELLAYNLTQAGFEVMKASDGKTALEAIENTHPDIVILDWMMPHLSGIDVCRASRKNPALRHIPIIMLSARGEEGDRTLGLDSGADDYMTKPFSPKELVARVKAVLRRTHPALTDEVFRVGDITLNPTHKRVERAGRLVTLGPKEFAILALLMERPGQVFSRRQLLDHIWGHGIYLEERTVDVHLSRLRKALNSRGKGEPPLPDAIRTVRGSGYGLKIS